MWKNLNYELDKDDSYLIQLQDKVQPNVDLDDFNKANSNVPFDDEDDDGDEPKYY